MVLVIRTGWVFAALGWSLPLVASIPPPEPCDAGRAIELLNKSWLALNRHGPDLESRKMLLEQWVLAHPGLSSDLNLEKLLKKIATKIEIQRRFREKTRRRLEIAVQFFERRLTPNPFEVGAIFRAINYLQQTYAVDISGLLSLLKQAFHQAQKPQKTLADWQKQLVFHPNFLSDLRKIDASIQQSVLNVQLEKIVYRPEVGSIQTGSKMAGYGIRALKFGSALGEYRLFYVFQEGALKVLMIATRESLNKKAFYDHVTERYNDLVDR
jgi:mRNA-degrading endonuclease RelE of RelBE toxin-antitoxin system